ncbi:putative pentatricopeptide repeat-containing protein [Dirofilaria immitis]
MIMLAAIHPYSNNNSNSNNTSDADKHTMKITDVTDQYLEDKDDEVQEGSLIEYCRINHHENAKCRPQIFLANKIIKITPLEHENFDKMA